MSTYLDGITSQMPTQNQTQSAKAPGTMNKDDFMKLLVAQLQYQDPMQPMDSTQFTSQLTQFSSLEQLFDINDNLQTLGAQQNSLGTMESMGLVGKEVTTVGGQVSLGEDEGATGRYELAGQAQVRITVYNSAGDEVREIDAGILDGGEHTFEWDGLTDDGVRCAAGAYTFKPTAVSLDGETVDATGFTEGTVTGVQLTDSGPRLIIGQGAGSMEVALGDLTEVRN